MSYLQDKKLKDKKFKKIALAIVVLVFLFYFRYGILRGFAVSVQFVAHPFLTFGKNVGNGFENFGAYFSSKKHLSVENETLKSQIAQNEATIANYNSVLDENIKMKEVMGRKNEKQNFIFATILAKPNRSIYDTLLIDAGSKDGVQVEQRVFALGNIPIGYIAEVYLNSAKVILYSSSGEKSTVMVPVSGSNLGDSIKNIQMEIVGRGGGNFEMSLPRDVTVSYGAEAVLPGVTPYTIAKVGTIISDPRDSYQKALLASPVNIFELGFVELEK